MSVIDMTTLDKRDPPKLRLDGADLTKKLREFRESADTLYVTKREFLAVYERPLKAGRRPRVGEEMRLTDILRPRSLLIAMYPRTVGRLPPAILTYTGTRTGAVITQLLNI